MSEKSIVEVYLAKNGLQAHLFVKALEEAGIKAEIRGKFFHPATEAAENPLIDPPGILVFVEDAERAKRLFFELEAGERKEAQEPEVGLPIEVVCEDCGSRTVFPPAQWGSVQNCSQCWAYVDVGEEEFSEGWENGQSHALRQG